MTDGDPENRMTVALVDDDESILDSLQTHLTRLGLQVMSFPAAPPLLDAIDSGAAFDCIVSDVTMPGMSGFELLRALSDRRNPSPIILVTGHGDIGMAVSALKAGASDFIEKPADEARLFASICEAAEAGRVRCQDEAERSLIAQRYRELSERQREVMGLAVQGLANKEIAAQLGISPRTVEHYREWAMERMKAHTFAELVHMAARLGLTGIGLNNKGTPRNG